MTSQQAENISASLVREYLSRKAKEALLQMPECSHIDSETSQEQGLKTTLQILDEELPRSDDSISNRQLLVKELHIEKIMKKNKEQVTPLKAMLEVITQYLMLSKSSGAQLQRNGDIDSSSNMQHSNNSSSINNGGNPRNASFTSHTSKFQSLAKEDTQLTIDGYPAGQDDEGDDLLRPDPNFSYPSHKRQPRIVPGANSARKQVGSKSAANSDLVIEDSHEGETVLGDGKTGVMGVNPEEDQVLTRALGPPPRGIRKEVKQPRSVGLGMSGPITNTEDTARRKLNKPRPMSASKNQRLNLFDSDSSPKISSLDSSASSSVKTVSKPVTINSKPLQTRSISSADSKKNGASVGEIETLISKDRKKSIEDVLDVEREQRPPTATRRQNSQEKETKHYSVDSSSIAGKGKKSSLSGSQSSSGSSIVKVGDLEMGEVDNLDEELAKLDVGPRVMSARTINKSQHNSKPIDVKTAVALKSLLFGTPMQSFNDEWRFQSFSFCDMPKLKYGIVQKKGGPCGVLASVQAFIVQELLFGEKKIPPQRFNEPSCEERTEALAIALAKIFWRAGEKRKAIVCIPSSRPVIGSGGKFRADEFIETLTLYTFIDVEELHTFMKQVINQFELDGLGGVILSLYSVILSRKIEGVKEDMDVPTNKLMGAHGYCTQEMVNLYVSGRAVSNVFNDVLELDSGEGNIMILKGVVSRCDVGLLSLFEHYKSCQVGTYLKTPRFPIWVLCSESHFSVLFCPKKELTCDWKAEKRFDLYYYDGLARQQEQIKLSINTNGRTTLTAPSEEDLVPPIEHCIRTKWDGAEVDWNGTEPLL